MHEFKKKEEMSELVSELMSEMSELEKAIFDERDVPKIYEISSCEGCR